MVAGKSLKFINNGVLVIDDDTENKAYHFSRIRYEVSETKSGKILSIITSKEIYEFEMKTGIGGMFGVSAQVKEFLKQADEQLKISQEHVRKLEEEQAAEEETGRRMQAFKDDTYELDYDAPDGYLLKKEEGIAIWGDNVGFYQEKTKRAAVGTGTSIRVAKGVSWRIGGAAPIESDYIAHIDTGMLVVTNQKISFIGDNKSVTIPMGKLIGLEAHGDYIEVTKDGVMKKYMFTVGNPELWAEAIKAMNRR